MEISGYHVFFGNSPGQAVVRGPGQFTRVTSRDGCVHDFMLEDAIDLAKICRGFENRQNIWVKLRAFWGDNSNGSALAKVQILVGDPTATFDTPPFPPTTQHGQCLRVEVEHLRVKVGDHFEPLGAEFYDLTRH
jgi:hypothetical protein